MKIKCSILYFGYFGNHFQIILTTHDSILSLIFGSMSELELFKWMRVLIKNSNTMELGNCLEKHKDLKSKSKWSYKNIQHVEP
jgi:hypothetical protein